MPCWFQHKRAAAARWTPRPKDIGRIRYELARRIRAFIEARKNEHGSQLGQEAGPENTKGLGLPSRGDGAPPGHDR